MNLSISFYIIFACVISHVVTIIFQDYSQFWKETIDIVTIATLAIVGGIIHA